MECDGRKPGAGVDLVSVVAKSEGVRTEKIDDLVADLFVLERPVRRQDLADARRKVTRCPPGPDECRTGEQPGRPSFAFYRSLWMTSTSPEANEKDDSFLPMVSKWCSPASTVTPHRGAGPISTLSRMHSLPAAEASM